MTTAQMLAALATAMIAWLVTLRFLITKLRNPPPRLLRTNYAGIEVPVVAGAPLAVGALVSFAIMTTVAGFGWDAARTEEPGAAMLLVIVVMYLAGAWDDLRGDERPRGFKGHLTAGGKGRLTGGLVKLIAGGACGLIAGALLEADWAGVLAVALAVALSANFVNLADRAPGRAAKVALVMSAIGIIFAAPQWTVAVAAPLGALIACVPADLAERVMLGDAGANPIGAVVGLGLALATDGYARWIVVAILFALNLASERWSFSAVIEKVRPLRALDGIGRVEKES